MCQGGAIALAIRQQGALVTAYDPAATEFARTQHPQLTYAGDLSETVRGAEALLHLTPWPEFTHAEPAKLAALAAAPNIIDGRAVLDPDQWTDAGWTFIALGRG